MKRFVVIGLCALLAGCASAPAVKNVSDMNPTGIVSITADGNITWYGEENESSGLLGDIIEKKVDKAIGESPDNLFPIAESTLIAKLKTKGVGVIEPAKILKSQAYLAAREDKFMKLSGAVVPAGYRFVNERDGKSFLAIAAANGMKSGIYTYFKFQKVMDSGVGKNGSAKACVTMNIFIVNESGKIDFQKSYYAASTKSFAVVSGLYKPASLMELFPEAINAVCDSFTAALVK